MIRRVAFALGLTLIAGPSAWAIPQTLNFQGLLKESGSPVNDTRQMTFKIWDAASEGSALFTEPASGTTNVIVSTGIFNFVIGSLTSGGIPLSVFDGSDRYIEVVVGATTLPRQKITSVANTFFAATAANLSTSAVIQISSAVFTATGSSQYSLQTSSGINVQAGGVTAPFFSGTFVGSGAGLTGISGTDSSKVAKAGDTMTGQLTLSGSTLTVTGSSFSVGGSSLVVAAGRIGVGTQSPATKLHLSSGTVTIDGSGAGMNVGGPSTATYFYGNGSGLTGIVASSDCTGVACRVGYSSGTAQSFSFVLSGDRTYMLHTSGRISSGSTNPQYVVLCTVNADTTASKYQNFGTSYPNARSINSAGATAHFGLWFTAGGVTQTWDRFRATAAITTYSDNTSLTATLDNMWSSNGVAWGDRGYYSWGYSGGTAPFTLLCTLDAAYSWAEREAILYQVGK